MRSTLGRRVASRVARAIQNRGEGVSFCVHTRRAETLQQRGRGGRGWLSYGQFVRVRPLSFRESRSGWSSLTLAARGTRLVWSPMDLKRPCSGPALRRDSSLAALPDTFVISYVLRLGGGSASILRPKARGRDLIRAEGQVPSRQQVSERAHRHRLLGHLFVPIIFTTFLSFVGFRKAHRFSLWTVDSPPRMEGRNVAGVRRTCFRWFSSQPDCQSATRRGARRDSLLWGTFRIRMPYGVYNLMYSRYFPSFVRLRRMVVT